MSILLEILLELVVPLFAEFLAELALLGGLLMSYIAWFRVRTWDWTIRLETFAYGFLFAFAMTLIRFYFAD